MLSSLGSGDEKLSGNKEEILRSKTRYSYKNDVRSVSRWWWQWAGVSKVGYASQTFNPIIVTCFSDNSCCLPAMRHVSSECILQQDSVPACTGHAR